MSEHLSPYVNSARLPDYKGKIVRLPCKVERLQDSTSEAIVKASDGGQVKVKLQEHHDITTNYIEVIGNVTGNDSLRAHAIIEMGDEFDLSLADFVVEKGHDPRFKNIL